MRPNPDAAPGPGDPPVTVTRTVPAAAAPDPADPPIVAALVAPLLELRASLGDGTMPAEITTALTAAADAATQADIPAAAGLYALEATDTATAGVPLIRRTATEVSALAGHHDALAQLLAAAYVTQGNAAAAMDTIISAFRSDARTMAATATSQADTDDIVKRASLALDDGVKVVNGARTEMDDHRRRAAAYDQGDEAPRVTVPNSWQNSPGGWPTTPGGYNTGGIPPAPAAAAANDPALAGQLALQSALIQGGVALGTAAIDGAVQVGTKIVDGIVQVATHGVDTGAKLAEQGISTLAAGVDNPGGTTTAPAPGGPNQPGQPNTGLFGGLSGPQAPQRPESGTPDGSGDDQADKPAPAPFFPDNPAPEPEPEPGPQYPAPAPVGTDNGHHQPGAVIPPAARPESGDQQRPRRTGQLGVNTPPGENSGATQ